MKSKAQAVKEDAITASPNLSILEPATTIGSRISVTPRTIQRMFKDGLIPGYRVSRKLIRFSWQEVEEAMLRLRIPASAEKMAKS